MVTKTGTLQGNLKAREAQAPQRAFRMKAALKRASRAFAGALLVSGIMLASASARAGEPKADGIKLTLSANAFGGKHDLQGVLAGGGLSLSGAAKNGFGGGASFELASIGLGRPVPYSYGAYALMPLAQNLTGSIHCKKDAFTGGLGFGGGLSMGKGPVLVGAGGEYRPGGTISMNASIGTKLKLAFLALKAKIAGFINTKSGGISAGGALASAELMTDYHVGLYGRYLYFTTGYGDSGGHAAVGGAVTRFSF